MKHDLHMGYCVMLPVAKDVMRPVPAITQTDGIVKVLGMLSEHGVAVLVDDAGRPFDILTTCDLEKVKAKVEAGLGKDAAASSLFEARGRAVFTVNAEDDLKTVAKQIANRGLSTGIVVVDTTGRYLGYLFSAVLRDTADAIYQRASDDMRRVKAEYPDAWSSVQRRTSSS